VFCLARYRQDKFGHKQAAEFFDTSNTEFVKSRMELLSQAVEDGLAYLNRGGEVSPIWILHHAMFIREGGAQRRHHPPFRPCSAESTPRIYGMRTST
jgi:hypothetical protein